MKSKLAGRLSLQDMISAQLETAREKLAASEPEDEKVKKLVEYEKSYHGHVPSVKEEKEEKKKATKAAEKAEEAEEKKAAAEDVEKLASALDYVGEMLKEADAIENGGEYKGGGEQLPTASPVAGKQPDKKDAAKRWAVLLSTAPEKPSDSPAATAMMTNENKVPGGAAYPEKGVLKTAANYESEGGNTKVVRHQFLAPHHRNEERGQERGRQIGGAVGLGAGGAGAAYGTYKGMKALEGVGDLVRTHSHAVGEKVRGIAAKRGRHVSSADAQAAAHHLGGIAKSIGKRRLIGAGIAGLGGAALGGLVGRGAGGSVGRTVGVMHGPPSKEKKSSVDYILNKIAEYKGGGETLDDQAAPVPANAGRELIQSNQALIDYTKRQAKSPRKAELAQVLVEPAMTAATDSKVNENLRNAPQAGVKIAAAKALLQKIAEEGCSCNGKKECRYCKMQAVLEKKKEEKKAE